MFAVTPYRIEFEDLSTGKWKPARVVGVAINDGDPRYVIETVGNLSCLVVVDYVRHPAPAA
jgi:hypothetical protein